MLSDFLDKKKNEERALIDFLYRKSDELNQAQLTELLRYCFIAYGNNALGVMAIKNLIRKVNEFIKCDMEPDKKEDFFIWLKEVFAKTDHEKQKSMFVTIAYTVYRLNFLSAAGLMARIDEAAKKLTTVPEFNELKTEEKNNG